MTVRRRVSWANLMSTLRPCWNSVSDLSEDKEEKHWWRHTWCDNKMQTDHKNSRLSVDTQGRPVICYAFMFSPFPSVFSKVLMCKVLKVNTVWAWNASSVVPLCHRVTRLYNKCLAASLLLAVPAQVCASRPIRADLVFGGKGGSKSESFNRLDFLIHLCIGLFMYWPDKCSFSTARKTISLKHQSMEAAAGRAGRLVIGRSLVQIPAPSGWAELHVEVSLSKILTPKLLLRALRWAGAVFRVYPALTRRQLGLAPATNHETPWKKELSGYRPWHDMT